METCNSDPRYPRWLFDSRVIVDGWQRVIIIDSFWLNTRTDQLMIHYLDMIHNWLLCGDVDDDWQRVIIIDSRWIDWQRLVIRVTPTAWFTTNYDYWLLIHDHHWTISVNSLLHSSCVVVRFIQHVSLHALILSMLVSHATDPANYQSTTSMNQSWINDD